MTVQKNSFRFWLLSLSAVVAIATVALLIAQPFATASGDTSAATYAHGVLHVTIPYHGKHPGAGKLVMEVLDPEDHVIGRAEPNVEVAEGRGRWQQDIKLDKPLALEDLVWHRLHYRLEYSDQREDNAIEGVDSISQILRTPVVHILGQQSYLAGSPAAVRLIVADSKNEVIPGRGSVRIELLTAEKKSTILYTGQLDRRGTTEAQFRFPAGLVGSYQLHYVADTPIGSTEFTQSVRLEDKVSILLTTEKPLYQPSQTIHVRALALDRASHNAAAGRRLTFELEDSRGNKVFKKITGTSKFGIASAEFELADEVNLGTYHLRALMGEADAGPTNTAEIALNVEKYVLPKFKVAIDLGGKDSKAKRGYRPGDHVTGTVRANYFFGKPVEGGEIAVKASGMDVAVFEVAAAQGKTDHDGSYHFDLRLPSYFAGRPLEHGLARVLIEATVKDTAGHSETRGEPITVSESPLIITAVPEGGTLAASLENQVFILTSYADGTPASAELKVRAGGTAEQHVTSDAGGVAVVRVNAASGGGSQTLEIDAADKDGNHASSKLQLQSRDGQDQILLRTEHAVYRAGDRIQLKVFSTKKRGAAYVDIVKEGQTILTRDLDIENGQAELSLTATPEMAGTVDFSAYLFGSDARPVGDHRLVFVQPADDLKIEAVADAPMYKPGAEARIRFRVANSRGEGVQAALGLQVVDEAVFALAEKQPGFAKVFFYLEQEVLKPRYEIHSIGMPEIVEPVEKTQADQRDQAARALFSATEMVNNNRFETEFGRTVPTAKFNEYAGRYQQGFLGQARKLAESLSLSQAHHGERNMDDLTRAAARVAPVRDAWGSPLQVEAVRWAPKRYYLVRSAGPDKQFDTGDDLATYLEVNYRKIVGRPSAGASTMTVNIEHDRGPFNGRAEITGTAMDQAGGALESVPVRVRNVATGKTRIVHSGAEGRFSVSGLEAGEYELLVSIGKETVSRKIKLDPRDRAVLAVSVKEETDNDIVVMDLPGMRERMVLKAGVVNGVFDKEARREAFFNMNGAGMADLRAMPPPAAAQTVEVSASAPLITNTATNAKDESGSSGARVRSYFPEALYINPEIITDAEGRASITIPMADSITTWRMAMVASTTHGALGSATSSLKVFQDFFVDLDLPVTLTQGDRVSIPVAVYNYSGGTGDVSLQLQPENWFALVDDTGEKNVVSESGKVGGSQFTIEARRIGKFKLTLSANMKGGAGRADVVVREIEVIPNGREQNLVFNGRLETEVRHELSFPAASIPDASKIFVRLYPGPLSQVIEGMDSILRMPGGCFEQTSSSTYPNVLALDYMKRTKKLTPEVHAKAEGYIANGYQRLLTFEVPGGGFSWFGNPPANKILTSYGLMEFYDMSKVYDVDQKLIDRTQQWLAGQQQADGSWKPDTQFINEGATNRYNTDALRITAYIAWSLENTGYHGPAVDKAKQFVESHMNGKSKADAYTLAVLANFAVDYGKDRDFAREAVQMLLDSRTEKDEQAWWSADETSVYATGASASIETTGLAVQALLKWGQASGVARKAMIYIASKKDASGTWGTTQATIMALRALLLATEKGAGDVRGTVEVIVNGQTMEKLVLTPANNDLLHQFVFKGADSKGPNTVEVRFEGKGGLAYQVVGRYFTPWDQKPENEPLSIDVAYDRTRLAQDDVVTATATVRNNLNKSANMVMVDLGIPPGFDLLSEDLQAYQEKSAGQKSGRLEKFSQTATQAILYFDSFAAHDTVKLSFRLRAKYPIRARTFKSRVYEYYDPEVQSVARPVQLEVKGR
ncbi:MAG: carboxypeptidase regulatory-like domain-containing protein [Acidobacteriia bacterium]|nr:carboxypeptidase regulatory-like domain-containing protein [Terriglobia bacterium]